MRDTIFTHMAKIYGTEAQLATGFQRLAVLFAEVQDIEKANECREMGARWAREANDTIDAMARLEEAHGKDTA